MIYPTQPDPLPPRDVDGTCSDDARITFTTREEGGGALLFDKDGWRKISDKQMDAMGIHPSAQPAARQTTWIWYAGIVLTVATVIWMVMK